MYCNVCIPLRSFPIWFVVILTYISEHDRNMVKPWIYIVLLVQCICYSPKVTEKQNFLLCSLTVNTECLFWYIIWPWWVLLQEIDVMHAVIFVKVYQSIISHICGTISCTKVRGISPLVCCPSCFFWGIVRCTLALLFSNLAVLFTRTFAGSLCLWLVARQKGL
jgi:hypothetical protein